MSLEDFINSFPDSEQENITLPESWNGAIKEALQLMQSEIDTLKMHKLDDHATGAFGCYKAVEKLIEIYEVKEESGGFAEAVRVPGESYDVLINMPEERRKELIK